MTRRALILLNIFIAIAAGAEFYAPYARAVKTSEPLANYCAVYAVGQQCILAKGALGRCSWSRVVGLNYVYAFKRPQGHALLAFDLNGRIYVYDVNVGSYELDVPKGCHDLQPIADALHRQDKHVFAVRYLD